MSHNPPEPLDVSYVTFRLIDRSTTELICKACSPPRCIIVDVIGLLDRWGHAFKVDHLERMVCEVCGKRLMQSGGLRVGAMQHLGKLPKLKTTDGSDWWLPPFHRTRRR